MMARGEVEVGVRNPVTCLLTTQEYTDILMHYFPSICLISDMYIYIYIYNHD